MFYKMEINSNRMKRSLFILYQFVTSQSRRRAFIDVSIVTSRATATIESITHWQRFIFKATTYIDNEWRRRFLRWLPVAFFNI